MFELVSYLYLMRDIFILQADLSIGCPSIQRILMLLNSQKHSSNAAIILFLD